VNVSTGSKAQQLRLEYCSEASDECPVAPGIA